MNLPNSGGAFNQDRFLAAKFLQLKDQYSLTTVIETGTYHGITTEWLSSNFEKVYTVECNSSFYDESKKRISGLENISHFLMDSPLFLARILPTIDASKTIVFLDAHWYTNPVLQELAAIKKSGKKPILAIHDFKVPDKPDLGYDIYPEQGIVYEWQWIEPLINSIYDGAYSIEYNTEAEGAMRGCIFIFPKK